MILRTKAFASPEEADNFEIPEGARNFRVQPWLDDRWSMLATWEEYSQTEQKWGGRVAKVAPALLGCEAIRSGRVGDDACIMVAEPYFTFRPLGIALLGVQAGARIEVAQVGTLSIGASAEPLPAELFEAPPVVVEKLSAAGIAELGQINDMVDPGAVEALIDTLQTHTPFVCRATLWPTCRLGSRIQVRVSGRCKGAVLWGLIASDYVSGERLE